VANYAREYPEAQQQARIRRALDVLLAAELRETEQAGVYLVQSCQDSGLYYRASGLHCTCPDHLKRPEMICKHSASVSILISAYAQAAWNACQGEAPTPPPPPAPAYCVSCSRQAVPDETGVCDLCAEYDRSQRFYVTAEGAAYLDRLATVA
jgi:hypothetical protein